MRSNRVIAGIGSLALLCLAAPALAADKPAKGKDATEQVAQTVAVFRLHGELSEAPPPVELGFDLEQRMTLHTFLERLRKAKTDENLKAVVITFDQPRIGLGQMQELRQALTELRAADKDVYCYIEEVSMGSYALATCASKIVIAPTGELELMGINVESAYFKGLLDKLRVEADIEHIGAYKGAGEPFTRTGPSPQAEEMLNWLIKDLFDQLVDTIAKGRQLPVDEVRALVDRGPFLAKDAKAAKLVDELAYAEDFTASLKKRYGANVQLKHDYGARKAPELDFSNIFALFKSIGELVSKAGATGKPAIGIVYVDGMIVTGKAEEGLFASNQAASTTLRREIGKARDDDNVKAVVLRVDSPGGSALASDIIWHATQELKGKKPFIVSMGNIAASGGYYVSCAGPTIFADPGTLTGSIGVVGGKIVTKGLWDWIGITFHQTKIGQNADLLSTERKFDDRERAIVRKLMQDIYGDFADRVKKGRGDKLKKNFDELAGGRVFTGRQAQANGLIDKLGGLQDAVRFAASEANVSDYQIRQFPEPKNFVDALIEGLTGEKKDKDLQQIDAGRPLRSWTLAAPGIGELLGALRNVDPQRVDIVLRSLMRIELLGREHVLLVTPAEMVVK